MRSKRTTDKTNHDRGLILLILPILLITPITHADQVIIAHATVDPLKYPERLVNPGFEETGGWQGWAQGFEPVDNEGRNGSRGVKCAGTTDSQHGASQSVKLGQDKPRPIIVTGWSNAENVDGSADAGYSIYLDINYADGDHLWSLTANFSVGTHDWEQRRVTFAPEKPIESLTVHALFRGHNGTVFFDDFSLVELGDEATMFDGVRTTAMAPSQQKNEPSRKAIRLTSDRGLELQINEENGAVTSLSLNGEKVGENGPPVFIRDVANDSDFVLPECHVLPMPKSIEIISRSDSLKLHIQSSWNEKGNGLLIRGDIRDLRLTDRAVTVYVPLPVSGDWTWCQDMRRGRPAKGTCINGFRTGAGVTGTRSSYPLAVLTGPKGGIALAVPMDDPRHHRLVYDSNCGLLYAAFDMGLSRDDHRASMDHPERDNSASFCAVLFSFDPKWGFRAALETYYRLFPHSFEKRVHSEGLWMAFTDISTIPNPEDFGFAYQEGAPNIAWDEQHGVLSFPYTEPMTTWLKLPSEVPRTYDGAIGYLNTLIGNKDALLHESASIIDVSSIHDADGRRVVSVVNAPWCDGCVFALNADPRASDGANRGEAELNRLHKAVTDTAPRGVKNWPWRGEGTCVPDTNTKQEGRQSLRLEAPVSGATVDAFQTVEIGQHAAKPVIIRGYVQTRGLTGAADTDCSIYVDFVLADGTPLYCQAIPIEPGTRSFHVVEKRIVSERPFQNATVHLLLRGAHIGTVWVDDLFLGEEGTNFNLLQNGGFEGALESGAVADGAYIDSYEFWANTIDYNRDHFSCTDSVSS